jgi:hypothetical protein
MKGKLVGAALLMLSGCAPQTPPAPPPQTAEICVAGTLTTEGIECPALRGEDGRLYTLTGDTRGYGPGDRVCVCGTLPEVSICMQGTTIGVTNMTRLGAVCP